ncbi:MAG: aminotransferase class I/II-fold pyridoxal phosphate-dependent enzyme [Candidatus Kariarchaeaceae archaeon]|jgi:8-amino-7-oxononanoate synthase
MLDPQNKIDKVAEVVEREKMVKSAGIYTYMQTIENATNRTVISNGKEMVMLGSYSYLGLIDHPRIIEASIEGTRKFGTGAGGVRLLTGTTSIHKELEKKIADYKRSEDAIVYSSGFLTNVAFFATMFDVGDLILLDRFAHQSIYDGAMLSKAHWRKFQHNDMDHLRKLLEQYRDKYDKVVIAVDAVYSMDGDIAPLPEIIELAKEFNVLTMVDEAHAIGVIGKTGRGIDEYYDLEPGSIDFWMGTFSKAIPSIGGYLAAKKDFISYLRYTSHPFIFSAALPPNCVATSIESLNVIQDEPDRVNELHKNIKYFIEGLKNLGFNTLNSKDTSIIPVIIGDDITTFTFSKMMFESGIFVSPIVYPAVPNDSGRLRCCVMATHTKEDLDKSLAVMEAVGKKLRII